MADGHEVDQAGERGVDSTAGTLQSPCLTMQAEKAVEELMSSERERQDQVAFCRLQRQPNGVVIMTAW